MALIYIAVFISLLVSSMVYMVSLTFNKKIENYERYTLTVLVFLGVLGLVYKLGGWLV